MKDVDFYRFIIAGVMQMANSMLRKTLRGKTGTSKSHRRLAIEQYEPRLVMDQSMVGTVSWMGGSDAFFDDSTITVQNGSDIFVLDVSGGAPQIRSTASVRNMPAAVAMDGKELTLVISSQVGLSEIVVYDLGDPMNPVVKETQPVNGIVNRAWIVDEHIVLQTMDVSEIPETIPVVTLTDLNSIVALRNPNDEVAIGDLSNHEVDVLPSNYGQPDSEFSKPILATPKSTLQIYDRFQLSLGARVTSNECGMFDEMVVLPDGIVTISTTPWPQEKSISAERTEAEDVSGEQINHWSTSTTLSRWAYNKSGSSLELMGSYRLENQYVWGAAKSLVEDGVTSLFILSARDAEHPDVSLHRFTLGTQEPLSHSVLKLSEYLDQDWMVDFVIDDKNGIVATGSKLILIDMAMQSEPSIIATRNFSGESSTWKHLGAHRWLRISNSYDTEGNVNDAVLSLEIVDVSSSGIEMSGKPTIIAGKDLNWSCYDPSVFTYLKSSGILVVNMQRYSDSDDFVTGQDALHSDGVSDIQVGDASLAFEIMPSRKWITEIHLLKLDSEDRIVELGKLQLDTNIKEIGESGGRVGVITDREVIMVDVQGTALSQTSLEFLQATCPIDALGIDPQSFVEILRQMGLGFIESMMDDHGSFVNLGLEKVDTEGTDEVIAITVGNESWQVRMKGGDEPELFAASFPVDESSARVPDVNGDGEVDSMDAKLLMERLNQRGFYPAPTSITANDEKMEWDINGDGWLSALDPLVVINRINEPREVLSEFVSEKGVTSTTSWFVPALQAVICEDSLADTTFDSLQSIDPWQTVSLERSDKPAIDWLLAQTSEWYQDEEYCANTGKESEWDENEDPLNSPIAVDRFESLLDEIASELNETSQG